MDLDNKNVLTTPSLYSFCWKCLGHHKYIWAGLTTNYHYLKKTQSEKFQNYIIAKVTTNIRTEQSPQISNTLEHIAKKH